jgi:dTDP-4-amino-4,6-dideoxygalactose transaminase
LLRKVQSGDDVLLAERQVADFVRAEHAVAVPQCRVGIYLALKVLIEQGQEVILSPYTIHEVVNMVICAGGRPVFADIDRQTCNIAAKEVRALIGRNTGAVLVTHLHGLACDVEEIAEICSRHGVPMLEDCAQAFGTKVRGQHVGTFGRAGIYSFGMAKNVNSLYGGMVVSSDAALAQALRTMIAGYAPTKEAILIRRAAFCATGDAATSIPLFWAGPYWVFRHACLNNVESLNNQLRGEAFPKRKDSIPDAYLRRMTPMQARMIRTQIRDVDRQTKMRIELAARYHDRLKSVQQIMLPPRRTDGSHTYLTFPIQVADRLALQRYLMQNLRDIAIQHICNTADIGCYSDFYRDCPHARATADQVILLPTYPSYGTAQVDRNIDLILRYYGA